MTKSMPPLLTGAPLPAPDWFNRAIAQLPERSWVEVLGTRIEMLTWGDAGKPGLLFIHGKGAHADWWSFIAPFFAIDFRVIALSWSGMGQSGWRESYPVDIMAEEAAAALDAGGGLAAGLPPVVVAHSYGSLVALALSRKRAHDLHALMLVDPPFFSVEVMHERRARWTKEPPSRHKLYPGLEHALQRFRFSPYQQCENLYIADFIARRALVEDVSGPETGWRWRFDPRHWAPHLQESVHGLPEKADYPLAVVLGDRSALRTQDDIDYMRRAYPPGTMEVVIPEAGHHVMIDQPIAFVAALRMFIAGL